MGVDKGKKQKVGEVKEENGGTEHIDKELVLSIEKLQEIQDELEKINEEASEKVLEVEQKYNKIRKPVYDKRNDIIKTIPDFWLTAFMSHPALSELLTEEDQKHFKPNPYFEDTKLTKTFTFLEEGTTRITATSIKWKEGMGISNGVVEEKKGNSDLMLRKGQQHIWINYPLLYLPFYSSHGKIDFKFITCRYRLTLKPSFFSWFSDTQHSGDIDEIQDEVAEIIKDDLWPNPLTYFNNEADEEEFEMVDDDDEDKDSDGSEDDDDQDDEDDDGEED
ncbi:UNVERIFIED_CONTAM: NAP1-related protein 2 [Sesamum calycinum]|uniref:NAP1-related protein 2 n=1 Tax=Sesamum calycinum TaxID=2727403 RepID=A0AAW2PSU3_9LAMI